MNIAKAFPDISMDWLLTGKGEMYTDAENAEKRESIKNMVSNPEIKASNEPQEPYRATAPKHSSPAIPTIIPPASDQKKLKRIILFFTDGSFEDYIK